MASESVIVRIRASRDGYFRCGIAHRSNATDHPIERFTEEQLERLKRDPDLTVQLIDGELPKGEDQEQDERKADEEPPASGDAKPATAKLKSAAKPAAAKGATKGGKGAKPAAKKEQPTQQPEPKPTGEGGEGGAEGGAP
ncbi:HI1506-related protein [Pseudomonas solani]|uniref:HI1506-related protein n=1 Tax=Pseudomonas solani TaxID=2731552 RepID=UPI0035BE4078